MARVGSIACPAPGCGNQDATVSQTAGGTLNIACHRCQFSGYGKAGTKAKRLIESSMTPDADAEAPAPAPAPKSPPTKKGAATPAAKAPPAPAPAAKAGFQLTDL